MNELDCLKAHHEEFEAMIGQIRRMLHGDITDSAANEVMDLISYFNAQLMVHLTMEDRHVYPVLLACENEEVREMAQRLKIEVGHLFREFQIYRLKWSSPSQVTDDSEGFLEDTETLFSLLNKRMTLEDGLLYPQAENLILS